MKKNSSKVSILKLLLWAIPFILIDIAIITHGFTTFYTSIVPITIEDKWQGALLTINITIAVFAVNFSFSSYQSSPYRLLIGNLSFRHTVTATVTLVLAILPLLVLAFSPQWVPTGAILVIPLVAYASIFLSQIASDELSPDRMIKRKASQKQITLFGDEFLEASEKAKIDPPEFEEEDKGPPPTHEIGWQLIPSLPYKDPFSFLRLLSKISIEQGDLYTFDLAVEYVLEATLILNKHVELRRKEKDLKSYGVVTDYALSTINRIGQLTTGKERQVFSERYLNKLAIFIANNSMNNYKDSRVVFRIITCMVDVGQDVLTNNNKEAALIPVIVARQWATRGLLKYIQNKSEFLMEFSFAGCATIIQSLGEKSIELKDVDFLYRCLEALGWLGCAAVKSDEKIVGRQCANSLVQLGRISRAADLQCFWTRCALSPADHAQERLEWMISWTATLEDKKRKSWGETLTEALSRLIGRGSEIRYIQQDGRWKYSIETSESPHIVIIDDNGRVKTIDYSNEKELKQFELY